MPRDKQNLSSSISFCNTISLPCHRFADKFRSSTERTVAASFDAERRCGPNGNLSAGSSMSPRRGLNQRDTIAGAIFFLFGIAFSMIAASYPLGTTMRMGPGYFPAGLGLILSCIGGVIAFNALRGAPTSDDASRDRSTPWPRLRPVVLISASILLFAVTIETVGLALATFAVVAVSSLANQEFRWPQVLVSGLVLSVVSVGVFAFGLRLPFRVLPF
jgi:hypothetical protein